MVGIAGVHFGETQQDERGAVGVRVVASRVPELGQVLALLGHVLPSPVVRVSLEEDAVLVRAFVVRVAVRAVRAGHFEHLVVRILGIVWVLGATALTHQLSGPLGHPCKVAAVLRALVAVRAVGEV